MFARQGEVMNPLQYVPFNQTLYFINGDDPAQVAWMKRQTPPTLESKIILVQGSIRLLITAIVISPVIIWSWDTVKETTADGMLAAAFVILYSGVLLFILYFCFSALTDLQKPDERKSDERNEDE